MGSIVPICTIYIWYHLIKTIKNFRSPIFFKSNFSGWYEWMTTRKTISKKNIEGIHNLEPSLWCFYWYNYARARLALTCRNLGLKNIFLSKIRETHYFCHEGQIWKHALDEITRYVFCCCPTYLLKNFRISFKLWIKGLSNCIHKSNKEVLVLIFQGLFTIHI